MSKSVMRESGSNKMPVNVCGVMEKWFSNTTQYLDWLGGSVFSEEEPTYIPGIGHWTYVMPRVERCDYKKFETHECEEWCYKKSSIFVFKFTGVQPEIEDSGLDRAARALSLMAEGYVFSGSEWADELTNFVRCLKDWPQIGNEAAVCVCPEQGTFVNRCFCEVRNIEVPCPKGPMFGTSEKFIWFFKNIVQHIHLTHWVRRTRSVEPTFEDILRGLYGTPYCIVDRYAALKTLCLYLPSKSAGYLKLHTIVDEYAAVEFLKLPASGVAEGFVDDVCSKLIMILRSVSEFFVELGGTVVDILKKVFNRALTLALTLRSGFFKAFHSLLVNSFYEEAKNVAGDAALKLKNFFLHPMMMLLWKTCVRWWLGYSLTGLIVELIWDPDGGDALRELFESISAAACMMVSDNKPESLDTNTIIVLVVAVSIACFTSLGPAMAKVNTEHMTKLIRAINESATMMDKLKVADAIKELRAYITGVTLDQEARVRFQNLYPDSIKFVDAHMEYAALAQPTQSDSYLFRHTYARCIKERPKWRATDQRELDFITRRAFEAAARLGAVGNFQYRRQPACFMFHGPPGLGKTRLMVAAASAIAAKELKTKPNHNVNDVVYSVNVKDGFQSGYRDQTIWTFTDFLQKMDTPGDPSVELQLLNDLINTSPICLNMASVEDKGMNGRCYLVVAATNLDLGKSDPLRVHVKNFVSKSSFRRRMSHVVEPVLKDGFVYDEKANKIVHVKTGKPLSEDYYFETGDVYLFRVRDTANNVMKSIREEELWTWKELLNAMYMEYMKCKMYSPDSRAFRSDASLIDDPSDEDIRGVGPVSKEDEKLEEESPVSFETEEEYEDDGAGIGPVSDKGEAEMWNLNSTMLSLAVSAAGFGLALGTESGVWLGSSMVGTVAGVAAAGAVKQNAGVCECSKGDKHVYALPCADAYCKENDTKMCEGDGFKTFDGSEVTNVCYLEPHKWLGRFQFKDVYREIPLEFEAGVKYVDVTHCTFRECNFQACAGDYMYRVVDGEKKYFRIQKVMGILNYTHEYQQLYSTVVDLLIAPLVAFIVGGAVSHSVMWLSSFTKQVPIEVDGLTYVYDSKQMGFVPEADLTKTRINVKGRWYVLVTDANNGKKWYPEGDVDLTSQQLLAEVTPNVRFAHESPSIFKSLFAVVDVDSGKLRGNLWALDSSRFVTPLHVARYIMATKGLVLKRDHVVKPLPPYIVSEKTYHITPVGGDMCVLEIFGGGGPLYLDGCREHFTKIQKEVDRSGVCRMVHRNGDGKLEFTDGSYFPVESKMFGYDFHDQTYSIPGKDCRYFEGPSMSGWCGALYIDLKPNAEQLIMGFHVARGRDYAVCHTVNAGLVHAAKIGAMVNNHIVEGVPECATDLLRAGLTMFGKTPHSTVRTPKVNKVRSWLYDDIQPVYDVAKVRTFENREGFIRNPVEVALAKLGAKSLEPIRCEEGMVNVAYDVINHLKPFYVDMGVPSWEETFSSDCGLPSIARKKSPGIPWDKFSSQKGFACEPLMDVPVPRGEWVKFMDLVDLKLIPEDWTTRPFDMFEAVSAICKGCMKVEPRLIGKVEEALTRLFTVVPMHEFLIERRYFASAAVNFSERNLLFFSALGLSPAQFGDMHDYLKEVGSDCGILCSDFKHMDASVKARFMRLIALTICEIMCQKPVGPTRIVDPLLPPLDRVGFMRYKLIMRLAYFLMGVEDAVVEPGTMHPSGSFLTCLINNIAQILLWVDGLSFVLKVSSKEVLDLIRMLLLGDDSLIAIPEKWKQLDLEALTERVSSQGFTVTGSDKLGKIRMYDLWDPAKSLKSEYTFLGRHFARLRDGRIFGLLEPERVEKTMAFVEVGKVVATFPQQVLATLQELKLHAMCDDVESVRLVEKMRWIMEKIGTGFMERAFILIENEEFGEILREATVYTSNHAHFVKGVAQGDCEFGVAQAGEGVASVEPMGANAPDDTTKFVSDVVEDDTIEHRADPNAFYDAGMEDAVHGEAVVFSRPYKIFTTTWTGVSPENIINFRMPSAYFDGNFNAQAKLVNNAFLRATLCARVVISSTPYSAGKLLFSVRPLGRAAGRFVEATGDPCVEIDAASGAAGVLKVSAVVPQRWLAVEHYKTYNDLFDAVQMQLFVLSPLDEVNQGGVTISIFTWLEDVELRGPTLTNWALSAQAGGKGKEPANALYRGAKEVTNVVHAISEAGHATAGLMKDVSVVVKSIGEHLVEVAAVAKTVLAVAAFAGLSVPTLKNNTQYIVGNPNLNFANMFGVCPAISLACNPAQANVLPTTIYAVRKDEMDIKRFVSRMGLVRTFGWAVDDATEHVIGEWRVNPGTCISLDGGDEKDLVPLNFVASMFRYWRGSLIYRISIAKTRFHAGTIEVLWQMGYGLGVINEDFEATNCYRAVWDIQESSSFEVYVPYISNTPWCKVMLEDQDDTTNSLPYLSVPTGFISLRVINPLVDGQGLASSKVEILVFARGGEDIEFAVPGIPSFGPPSGGDMFPVDVREMERGVAEAGDGVFQDDESKALASEVPPFIMAPSRPISDDSLMCCIGERIDNLRLLLKRFSPATFLGVVGDTPVYFDPWMQLRAVHPYFAYMCQAFAFVSGGVRFQLVSVSTGLIGLSLLYGPTITYTGRPVWITPVNSEKVFSVPYQHIVPFVPMAQTTGTAGDFCGYRIVFTSYPSGAVGNVSASFAGSDDLNFGWQIGVPAMTITYNGQTQQYCPSYTRYN